MHSGAQESGEFIDKIKTNYEQKDLKNNIFVHRGQRSEGGGGDRKAVVDSIACNHSNPVRFD